MISGIRLKVCGLTSLVDAELADRVGADCLGFIFYPKSPRGISLAHYAAMAKRLPDRRRVAVSVEPTDAELRAYREAGFDFFQIHFPLETPEARLASWAKIVGRDRLWLAPKLPPETEPTPAMLAAAKYFLVDTFHAAGFGGSGLTGDWGKFARLKAAQADHVWILAGGLNPENITEALRASGTKFVDVNSGVESAPGVKDEAKLLRFVAALRAAAAK